MDIIRFGVGVAILSYASYTDLKYREASNKLWLIMGMIGAILLLCNFNNLALISIAISFPIAFLLYFFGMGGADVKAMWGIAVLSPLPPNIYGLPIFKPIIFVFPLIILINSLLLFIPLPFLFFFYNALEGNIEFPYCFFGYKMKASIAKNRFVWSMEKNGKKSIAPIKDFDFESAGDKEIWVTPKMPFLLFLFIGYIISFIFGDILFAFLSFLQ